MAAQLDINIQRNEDYAQGWTLLDDAGMPIDISGWLVELEVKEKLENSTVLQAADITITDAPAGKFDVVLAGPGNPLGAYGNPLWPASLPYDLLVTDTGGLKTALVRGNVNLSRGITS